jgi:hypothetical protein
VVLGNPIDMHNMAPSNKKLEPDYMREYVILPRQIKEAIKKHIGICGFLYGAEWVVIKGTTLDKRNDGARGSTQSGARC